MNLETISSTLGGPAFPWLLSSRMLFNHPAKLAALGKSWTLFSPYPMTGRGSWISRCPQLAPSTKLAPMISLGASLPARLGLLALQTPGKRLGRVARLCLSLWRENENSSNLELILQMDIFSFPDLAIMLFPPTSLHTFSSTEVEKLRKMHGSLPYAG